MWLASATSSFTLSSPSSLRCPTHSPLFPSSLLTPPNSSLFFISLLLSINAPPSLLSLLPTLSLSLFFSHPLLSPDRPSLLQVPQRPASYLHLSRLTATPLHCIPSAYLSPTPISPTSLLHPTASHTVI